MQGDAVAERTGDNSRLLFMVIRLIEVKKMIKEEEKKAQVKAIEKAEIAVKPTKNIPAKHLPAKHVPAKHLPAVHVLTTFDDLVEDFRRNFIESVAFPWDWVSVEPYCSSS